MRPSDGRFNLWPIGVVAFFVVLAVVSISPVKRLNETIPSDFRRLRVDAGKPNEILAEGYWRNAGDALQWRYPAAQPLPSVPPDDFRSAGRDQPSAVADSPAARQAYWAELRSEWLKPENWHTSYAIDPMWMWRDLVAAWNGMVNLSRSNL